MKKQTAIILAVLIALVGTYLALWAYEWYMIHEWIYSTEPHIKALEVMCNVITALFWSCSPAWILVFIQLILKRIK